MRYWHVRIAACLAAVFNKHAAVCTRRAAGGLLSGGRHANGGNGVAGHDAAGGGKLGHESGRVAPADLDLLSLRTHIACIHRRYMAYRTVRVFDESCGFDKPRVHTRRVSGQLRPCQ